jgi:membrane-bound serine protease (ClpP class)
MPKLFALFTILLIIAAGLLAIPAQAAPGDEVLVIDVTGPVTPVMHSFIERSIQQASERRAGALIIRLNTPGGSVDLTKLIIQTIIAADVPVVVYVWPPGGMAASAGTFITLAGHAAAMAPNTSIGAASPVDETGGDVGETLRAKIENILPADIRGLTVRRGDKAREWAEKAITEAIAATAPEALELGVIDFVAADLPDLLTQLDGFEVEVNGRPVTLHTADARITFVESTFLEQLLAIITNPNIALLFISLGSLAIAYEFINPGGHIGWIVGVILLLVGFFAIGQLPVNYAGLALIFLAVTLFIAELFTPTFGALTATGVVAFILGAIILFNTSEFAYEFPLPSIIGIPLAMAALIGFGFRKVMQARRRQPATGPEGLVGSLGTVRVALEPAGAVFVWGERWQAVSQDHQPIPAGAKIKVTKIEGLTLTVERVE